MSIFTVCTATVPEGKLTQALGDLAAAEPKFNAEAGVLWRRFFQCRVQPHVIWAVTEWISERHHHDAAQSLMQARRDDRIAAILFGPDPYYEIFCDEETDLRVCEPTPAAGLVLIAQGLIGERVREAYLAQRAERAAELAVRVSWQRVYRNRYHRDEFVAMLGFRDDAAYRVASEVDGLRLEEVLLTGLREPLGMARVASYNQYHCQPLELAARKAVGALPPDQVPLGHGT
jgi:hypothetical protein